MEENYVVVHFNSSDSGWVESGPYVDGWFTTEEEAQAKASQLREEACDGWKYRVEVWTAETYYERR